MFFVSIYKYSFVYIYIYIFYIYIYMFIYYIYIHIRFCIHKSSHINIASPRSGASFFVSWSLPPRAYVCIQNYKYVFIHVYIFIYIYIWIYMYIHLNICTCIYIGSLRSGASFLSRPLVLSPGDVFQETASGWRWSHCSGSTAPYRPGSSWPSWPRSVYWSLPPHGGWRRLCELQIHHALEFPSFCRGPWSYFTQSVYKGVLQKPIFAHNSSTYSLY